MLLEENRMVGGAKESGAMLMISQSGLSDTL